MTTATNPEFGKANALKLIQGVEDAKEGWKNFKKYIDDQVDPALKIDKRSVIIAHIIEASDLTLNSDTEEHIKVACENCQKKTVKNILKKLSKKERLSIEKKYDSIRNLVSMATKEKKPTKSPGDRHNTNVKKPEKEKIRLSGKTFKELKPQLSGLFHELSEEDLEAVWLLIDAELHRRSEQEPRKAS